MEEKKRVSFGQAVILLVIAIAVIIIVKAWLAADTSVSLLCAAAPVCALAMIWGVKWDDIETEIKENFKSMCSPVMILMCVGMLVGTWTISGTIPSLVYYGMQFISPGIFLVVTCLIGALMSIMTGTSWGTISTAGVALMGVSIGLGIPPAYTAGAITTGALFGDKLSPLSDTTVMSSAVCDVDIVDHIKYLLWTTVPSLVVSLVLYAILGLNHTGSTIESAEYDIILSTLDSTFNINPIMLIPPVVVIALIVLKKPTVPTFFSGILVAMVLAWVFQGASFMDVINAMASGYAEPTGVEIVDTLVIRGGLNSMLGTIVMVLAAGVFGGPTESFRSCTCNHRQAEQYHQERKTAAHFSHLPAHHTFHGSDKLLCIFHHHRKHDERPVRQVRAETKRTCQGQHGRYGYRPCTLYPVELIRGFLFNDLRRSGNGICYLCSYDLPERCI